MTRVLWARQHISPVPGYGEWKSCEEWARVPVTAWGSLDLDSLPVASALHDLERLAGEVRS